MPDLYKLKPIGIVRSRYHTREAIINSKDSDREGEIEIFEEYAAGLQDLDGFSHIIVIWWMHKSSFRSLKVQPLFRPEKLRGVFATRHPDRPNPVGLSVVELVEIKGAVLKVRNIDMLNDTPVIDLKPYTRGDQITSAGFGWLDNKKGAAPKNS